MIPNLSNFWDALPVLFVLLVLHVGSVLLVVRRVWRAVASERLAELAYRERLAIHRREVAGSGAGPAA
jgi:hypothetical protein